jgi:hypothetical protein
MRASSRLALGVFLHLATATWSLAEPQLEFSSQIVWRADVDGFGGFSALWISQDGSEFIAVSDQGRIGEGRLKRDNGKITEVTNVQFDWLRDPRGQPVEDFLVDAEGIAVDADGNFYVSFEAQHRIWKYSGLGSNANAIRSPRDFASLQNNSGLEGLAIDDQRRLYTLPERSGRMDRPFPVYRYTRGSWDIPFRLPRRGEFLPVSLDFGPDGKLYLLERDFSTMFFSSRIRRFTIDGDALVEEEELLSTLPGRHQNLEGLSVWRDEDGNLRLTMISDDGFKSFWSTRFVEYRLIE